MSCPSSSSKTGTRALTALQLLKMREGQRNTLSVGCPVIDQVLRGGFPLGGVTEISGEAGCGKTQICLTLALQCTLPESQGGLDGSVCYLSCGEGSFPVSRLSQLASSYEARGLGSNLMSRVLIQESYSSEDNLDNIRRDVRLLCKTNNVRMVIIDSIAGIFRTEFDTSRMEDRLDRTRAYFTLATELKLLADTYRLCIVVVNQVTAAGFDAPEAFADPFRKLDPVPALGLSWSHCINVRIMLRKDNRGFLSVGNSSSEFAGEPENLLNRQANPHDQLEDPSHGRTRRRFVLDFSPLCPPASCEYMITTGGVKGVPGTFESREEED